MFFVDIIHNPVNDFIIVIVLIMQEHGLHNRLLNVLVERLKPPLVTR